MLNIMMIDDDRDYQIILRDYGRIARMLKLLWGSDMFTEYIDNLMHDTRDGQREGFPEHIAESLLALKYSHDRLHPQFNKPRDPTEGWFKYG